MGKIHVILKKEELAGDRLSDKVIVVLDILFATTTIVTALANGAKNVIPVADEETARRVAGDRPSESYVLAGEFLAQDIPGFASATPLALLEEDVFEKSVIYRTTNGTVALHTAKDAQDVYAGSLLNAAALAKHLSVAHGNKTIVIVCSGSANRFNLEDFFGAGYLIARILERLEFSLSDSASAALLLARANDSRTCLSTAAVGRAMRDQGLVHEVEYAAQCDIFDFVARLDSGVVCRL